MNIPGMQQVRVDDPIKSVHDMKTTRETIKTLLADGTPDWVRFPNDYKAFAKESFLAEKEQSEFQVAGYKMDDQDILTHVPSRKVNVMRTRDIVQKLRSNDVKNVKCFTVDNGMQGTVALWASRPNSLQMVYVCYLQVPYMCEWSILRLDRHELPNGEAYRGWRTMVAQLIVKGILTEQEAHELFGHAQDGPVSRRYRRTLYHVRNHTDLNAQIVEQI